jgi:hypothetical protein
MAGTRAYTGMYRYCCYFTATDLKKLLFSTLLQTMESNRKTLLLIQVH